MNTSVGISDWKVESSPNGLITYALGSCVGICLYDKTKGIAGLSHIMLPDSKSSGEAALNRMKFADTAIPDMLRQMLAMGALKARIHAKIAGGATMFNVGNNDRFNIGERNTTAVKSALQSLQIPILAQDTGKDFGRTMIVDTKNGMVTIKSATKGVWTL
jgi:chemotaxis protein CheD